MSNLVGACKLDQINRRKAGVATVKDEIAKYLFNEKQIPSTGYIRYWFWNKVKDFYLKYVDSQKGQ